MANTTSLAWPNLFNVSQNSVAVYEDNRSITSRCRLLLLTEPTEIYNEPEQGVGLKRYMFRYNNENVKAEIRDRFAEQLAIHEPCVNAANTKYADGLMFTGKPNSSGVQKYNELEMTLSVETIYGDTVTIDPNNKTV